jgi:hypothetical protein
VILGAAPRSWAGRAADTVAEQALRFLLGQASEALQADGFKSVRTLAERDGLVFVEAIKPRIVG